MTATMLELLRATAPVPQVDVSFGARKAELRCVVRLVEPNGDKVRFDLVVACDAVGVPFVREPIGRQKLPAACPARHIQADGSFCLRWDPIGRNSKPADDAAARTWWQELLGYLDMQLYASAIGMWPDGKEWAHGRAAEWQRRFEERAEGLPSPLVIAAKNERLRTVNKAGRDYERRAPCPCGSGRRIKNCDHESAFAELLELYHLWQAEERRFWDSMADLKCCRTMRSCRLATASRVDR